MTYFCCEPSSTRNFCAETGSCRPIFSVALWWARIEGTVAFIVPILFAFVNRVLARTLLAKETQAHTHTPGEAMKLR